MIELWQHKRSGEVYAVEIVNGRVINACGPLHHSEIAAAKQGDTNWDADVTEDIQQHQGEYKIK